MNTEDLTGRALDFLVAKCEGPHSEAACYYDEITQEERYLDEATYPEWRPSTNWAQGGPIIEREQLLVQPEIGKEGTGNAWYAIAMTSHDAYGPTPLIAAMRCYVASNEEYMLYNIINEAGIT